MSTSTRRQLIGMGLTGGTAALLSSLGHAEIGCVDEAANRADCALAEDGLRFLVPGDYRPDLTIAAQQGLTKATLDFMYDTHPPGMTLAIWEENPRDMPQLEQHIAATVAAVYAGVEANLNKHPVDPVLLMSLLYNESRFSPVVVSPAGALGMAQFMPNTALEYELSPVAQIDLWNNYRTVRDTERSKRRNARSAFVKKFGMAEFSANAVIDYTLKKDQTDALAAYQALANADKPEQQALDEYLVAVREELAQFDFFTDGEAKLRNLDARASYAAATTAVDYLAQRLAENSGMTSSAVAAYNAGPGAVRNRNPRSILYGYGNLPAYPETVRYLQRVMVVYSKLRAQLA